MIVTDSSSSPPPSESVDRNDDEADGGKTFRLLSSRGLIAKVLELRRNELVTRWDVAQHQSEMRVGLQRIRLAEASGLRLVRTGTIRSP